MLENEGREMIVGEAETNAPPLDQKDVVVFVNQVQIHSKENCDNVLCSESKFVEGNDGGGEILAAQEKMGGKLAILKRKVSLENHCDQRFENAREKRAFQNKLRESLVFQEKMNENLAFQSTFDEIPPNLADKSASAPPVSGGNEGPYRKEFECKPPQNNEGLACLGAAVSFSFPPGAARSSMRKGFSLENQSFNLEDLNQLEEEEDTLGRVDQH